MFRFQSAFPVGLFAINAILCGALSAETSATNTPLPNIVLVMADDMGWGQTGYYQHPVLKTPHLDAMAESGLRLDRFYAAAPVCSPTRASVLTGRSNDRTGVESHGYALRHQETTIAQLLRHRGYATGHFGKWHLNGLRGPGVPILASDSHHPGHFGFDTWLSVTNFFDRDPIMSRNGRFEEFAGDSSEIIVNQALEFISRQVDSGQPFFAVIWYGTPHDPFLASDADSEPFQSLSRDSKHHYGELVAMDRSIGTLRQSLRDLQADANTLIWFCSDNGGLAKIQPETVGGLRGNKGTIFEGGLRVPAIIEWPRQIKPRVTKYPASTMDIFPTLVDMVGLDQAIAPNPIDGVSIMPLFEKELGQRQTPIPFRHNGRVALIDNDYKLLTQSLKEDSFELYNLTDDPTESNNLIAVKPQITNRLQTQLLAWNASVNNSVAGKDYPEGAVDPKEPKPRFWMEVEEYKPYFSEWETRWEYRSRLKPKR